MKERVILHSDCNGFYASVECLHNPKIRNKPVAVAGDVDNRHGIILAKNEIAKKYNIKTGEAIWQAKNKCHELIVVPPRFELYKRFSKMAKQIYGEYSNRVENFGLDEAWIDVTGDPMGRSGSDIAREIRGRIKYELGITVSIGVSFNKIFAKFGSDYKKPDAVTEISKDNYKDIVWPQPSSDLLYVGRATKDKLAKIGIYTIGGIANTPIGVLRNHLGKWGDLIYSFANGYDSSPVAPIDFSGTVKSVGNSTTTPRDLVNNSDVKSVLFVLCDSVCRRIREQGMFAKTVCISIRDNRLMSFTRQEALPEYTDITRVIQSTAMDLFVKSYNWENNIRSIGVTLTDLVPNTTDRQMNIIEGNTVDPRMESLDRTLDRLKERFGNYCVRNGSLLIDRGLTDFNPKEEHTIHPVGYF